MTDNASFFHRGEFGLGVGDFIRIQVARFGENRGSGVCEKMVGNLVARRRSCETIRGEDVGKFREKVGDTLRGREEISSERRIRRWRRGKA